MIYELIRKIENVPSETEASVVLDTDDVHVLFVRVYNYGKMVFSCHFNISWLEHDEKKIDWLAWVLCHELHEAYRTGLQDDRNEIIRQLKGIKNLLNLA